MFKFMGFEPLDEFQVYLRVDSGEYVTTLELQFINNLINLFLGNFTVFQMPCQHYKRVREEEGDMIIPTDSAGTLSHSSKKLNSLSSPRTKQEQNPEHLDSNPMSCLSSLSTQGRQFLWSTDTPPSHAKGACSAPQREVRLCHDWNPGRVGGSTVTCRDCAKTVVILNPTQIMAAGSSQTAQRHLLRKGQAGSGEGAFLGRPGNAPPSPWSHCPEIPVCVE